MFYLYFCGSVSEAFTFLCERLVECVESMSSIGHVKSIYLYTVFIYTPSFSHTCVPNTPSIFYLYLLSFEVFVRSCCVYFCVSTLRAMIKPESKSLDVYTYIANKADPDSDLIDLC